MTETQEVAQGMLAAYRAWLAEGANVNTRAWALGFVTRDAILKDDSYAIRYGVAEELYRAAKQVQPQTGSEQTRAALSDLQAHMAVAGVPDRPIKASEQTEREAREIARDKAAAMLDGSRGMFAAHLAEAMVRADSVNAHRLITAFPHLFT